MAAGLDSSATGGVLGTPSVQGLGADQWSQLTGMHPGNPLVGGYAGSAGFGRVATVPNTMTAVASGHPGTAHWSQLFNLKGNPMGWILMLALAYLALHKLGRGTRR